MAGLGAQHNSGRAIETAPSQCFHPVIRELGRGLRLHWDRGELMTMDGTWILLLEAFGILAVMLLLIWWTMRGKR